jgi:hypothetical protein
LPSWLFLTQVKGSEYDGLFMRRSTLECSDFDFIDIKEHEKTAMDAKFNSHVLHAFFVSENFEAKTA